MGLGCNACGVMGCRIIQSPRERLIAILTNAFIPCNGRLPMLISLITMFFVGAAGGLGSSVLSAEDCSVSAVLIGVGCSRSAAKTGTGDSSAQSNNVNINFTTHPPCEKISRKKIAAAHKRQHCTPAG